MVIFFKSGPEILGKSQLMFYIFKWIETILEVSWCAGQNLEKEAKFDLKDKDKENYQ